MKTEFIKVPGKGICILISGFTLEDIYKGIPTTEMSNANGIFKDINTIASYIREGKKINAIKEIRAQTGWGLKESKEYIDNLFTHRVGYPYNMTDMDYEAAANKFVSKNIAIDFLNMEDVEL